VADRRSPRRRSVPSTSTARVRNSSRPCTRSRPSVSETPSCPRIETVLVNDKRVVPSAALLDRLQPRREPLGGTDGGVLLMNPAPIIGLSATVGAPERFSAWLESVEKRCGSLPQRFSTDSNHAENRSGAPTVADRPMIGAGFMRSRKFAYAPHLTSFPKTPIGPLDEYRARPQLFSPVHSRPTPTTPRTARGHRRWQTDR
jgi:hypothetical protein